MSVKTKYLATCNPGFEDITSQEIREEVPNSSILETRTHRGRILFEAPLDELTISRIGSLRSIHSAYLLLANTPLGKREGDLEKIYDIVSTTHIGNYIPLDASFAVRATRIGEGHEYTSMDLARITGDAVGKVFKEIYGHEPFVRLNAPSITIYAEIDDEIFRLGIQLFGEKSFHRRGYRIYDHPAALKSSLAYSMLRLVGAKDGSTILDPMCGGGTVAIEASLLFETANIICVDKSRKHIEGAILNSLIARVSSRIKFYVHDARFLDEILEPNSVDYVVSNPPYGIRMGDPGQVRALYREFLPSLYKVMSSNGKASIITADSYYFEKYAREAGFTITHRRKVRHGDLWATVLILEKKR